MLCRNVFENPVVISAASQVNAEAQKISKDAEEANAIAVQVQSELDKAIPALTVSLLLSNPFCTGPTVLGGLFYSVYNACTVEHCGPMGSGLLQYLLALLAHLICSLVPPCLFQ